MSNQSIVIAVLIVAVLGAGAWYAFSIQGQDSSSNKEVVATVNGEKITNSDFQAQLTQAEQMDLGLEKKELETQVLDQMISNVLVKQEAEEKGLSVGQDEISSEMDRLIENTGGKEAFEQQLQKANLTREELKERIREQLLVQKYIEEEISEDKLEVTDEEMKSYFNQMMAQQGGDATNTPSFEEMEEAQKKQIKAQLRQQKRSQEVQKLVKKLREKAEIQTSINN